MLQSCNVTKLQCGKVAMLQCCNINITSNIVSNNASNIASAKCNFKLGYRPTRRPRDPKHGQVGFLSCIFSGTKNIISFFIINIAFPVK